MKKIVIVIAAVLLTSIVALSFIVGKPGSIGLSGPQPCRDLSQNDQIIFSSIKLSYDFSQSSSQSGVSYSNWEYDADRDEIYNAHYNNHSNDGISGYFDSFSSITSDAINSHLDFITY